MKDKNVAALLAFFLGGLGIQWFYLGKPLSGMLYFLFSWTLLPSVIGVIEAIWFAVISKEQFDKTYNK
tara:strand:+ start:603 stop:806 length:204 start_codon:yes stop_codon:yes gene_type:complete